MSTESDLAILMALIEQANNVVNSSNTQIDQATTQGSSQSSSTVSTLTILNTAASAIVIPAANGVTASSVSSSATIRTNQNELTNASSSIASVQKGNPSTSSVANTSSNVVGTVSKTGP